MDFKRIEWIFFLAFLGVNIFLLSIFRSARSEVDNVTASDQKIAIEQRLKADDIKYDAPLETAKAEGYYLSGEPTDMNKAFKDQQKASSKASVSSTGMTIENNQLSRKVADGFHFTNPNDLEPALKKYLNQPGAVLFGSEYTYLPTLSMEDKEYPEITASQSFEGIPFNDPSSRLEITLENTDDLLKVTGYTQTHLSNIEKLREKMSLYSEQDAIETLYINNRIPPKSKIAWRMLSYTLSLQFRGTNVYVPAWFVAIDTGSKNYQVERVNALTNKVFTSNSVQKVENN
ncbi:two-component system regulatory protein YycI [Enterococcus sp. 2201sp1_2201st1_B8_2201SCRN_220225]|uniref:two-component system regulatory protein YycI n=1 Tax=unclassified Enterococcus TaxID=2608891 RepID=UPI0034A36DEB